MLSYGSWGTIVSWNIETGSTKISFIHSQKKIHRSVQFDPHFPTRSGFPQENSFYIDFLRRGHQDGSITGVYAAKVEDIIGCSSATATTLKENFHLRLGMIVFKEKSV
jgi:hypothetical protein